MFTCGPSLNPFLPDFCALLSTALIQITSFPEWLSAIEQFQHFIYICGRQPAVVIQANESCGPAAHARLILGKFGKPSYTG
jgi:ABC-type uncharacterized transport system permease subunit